MVHIVDAVEHLPDHPAYWNWAASITAADVADVITSGASASPEDLQ
ncbi:hypothetical protein ABZ383_26430 [Streptomyces sp. NPDC005900]